MKRLARQFSIVLVIAMFTGLILLPASAFAIEYRGVGGLPANPREDNPRSKSIFVYELKPGGTASDGVRVNNGSDREQKIVLYPVDSQMSSGGAFACEQKADKADKVGSWIKMDRTELTLGPQSSEVVNFTINVPKTVDVGEHNGCIAIQSVSDAPVKEQNGLALSFRSAIRVAVTIPGDIKKSLVISKLESFKATDSKKQGVRIELKNGGNVSLDPDLTLTLINQFGKVQEEIKGTYAVLAGVSTELNFEFKRPIVPGNYTVKASIKYNDDPKVSLGLGDKKKEIMRETSFMVWPNAQQIAIMLVIIAVILGIIGRIVLKRYILSRRRKSAKLYVVKDGDSLFNIAEKFDADWQDIATINKLSAKSKLHEGQKIYVPTAARPKAARKKRIGRKK